MLSARLRPPSSAEFSRSGILLRDRFKLVLASGNTSDLDGLPTTSAGRFGRLGPAGTASFRVEHLVSEDGAILGDDLNAVDAMQELKAVRLGFGLVQLFGA